VTDTTADAVHHDGRMPPNGGSPQPPGDKAPGEHHSFADGVRAYLIGLGLTALLTAGSFALSYTHLVYGPGLGAALIVFAIAQIGIHLVFFLHLTTAPDNINNTMALAFGTLIVVLLIGGTLWIMGHMNAGMIPIHGMAPMTD
jgi:cytochrome o ubiquinol oxidase subunit IV